VLTDIDERKREAFAKSLLEERLRECEEFSATLNGNIQVGVLIQTSTAEIVFSNSRALELLGVTKDQLLGKTSFDTIWNVIHEDGTPFPGSAHPVPQAIATGRLARNIVMGVFRPATRDRVWLDVNATPILNANGSVTRVICTFGDITALLQAGEKQRDYAGHLQKLLRRLMELQENERRHLGRELHDRTGTNLSALLLSLGVMRTHLSPESLQELGPRIGDLEGLLRETIAHVKDVLADVHPPALSELGLVAALGHYVRVLGSRTGLRIDIEGQEPAPRVAEFAEIALFRIAQEALNNAAKYARSSVILVSVHVVAGHLVLTIEDDGAGFDPAAQQSGVFGIGMETMRERALAIGANLAVVTAVGKGTSIVVELQLSPAPAART
jgi:PAS domain S-box-containing protein